jgi:hypothetical protein
MSDLSASDLEKLALDAAATVTGAGQVERVDVASAEDSDDEPVYVFTFLIGDELARQPTGVLRNRLGQRLRDLLMERNDTHYPIIRILDRADWGRRNRA